MRKDRTQFVHDAPSADGALLPLNRSEHACLASDGYLGPNHIATLIRLAGPVDIVRTRIALRELVSAFPRLRAVVVPTLTTYEIRILPDDVFVDQLVDEAFRVRRDVDPSSRPALEAFHNEVLNDPMPTERGLAVRLWVLPHPERPALMLVLSHLVGDGQSALQIVRALTARLGGSPIPRRALDRSSQTPGLYPLAWWRWPASVTGYVRNRIRDARNAKGSETISLASRASPRFTSSAVRYHELPVRCERLREEAKRLRTNLDNLFVAALANALLARSAERGTGGIPRKREPESVAAIRVSVDLRRYFPEGTAPTCGSFADSFVVRAKRERTLAAQVRSVEGQVRDHLNLFERRENALPFLLPRVGRRLHGRLVLEGKERGLPDLPSCHVTSCGDAESPDSSLANARVESLFVSSAGPVPTLTMVTFGGRVFLGVVHPRDEVDAESMDALLAGLDAQLRALAPEPYPEVHELN